MKLLRSFRLLPGILLIAFVPILHAQIPVINSPGNATGQIAVPFAYTINATGSPTSYSITSTAPSSLIQSVYRGAFGSQTSASGKIWMSGSGQEFPNSPAFAAITSNGSAVAWGNPDAGGNATAVSASLTSNVTAIYSNAQAFAALKSNGAVVTWGDAFSGGSSSGAVGGNLTSGVVSISSANLAFAALKSNGSVVTWGDPERGGNSTTRVGGNLTSNVTAVFSNAGAFAALKSNGSVVTWGDPMAGGNATLFEFDQDFNTVGTSMASQLTSGVVSVSSTAIAFAARKSNGSVVTWGDMAASGGYTPPPAGSLSSNVTAVFSNDNAFAALKSNGSVVTWGASMSGGDSSSVSAKLTSGVTAIYSNPNAFAALKNNGSVVTWGMSFSGGVSTFPVGGNLTSGVTSISSNQFAFAALKTNGSVVTWGDSMSGGDSSPVADSLTSNVTAIYATLSAFAALKKNGSVVTWGFAFGGGDSTSVANLLTSNVTAIAANSGAFAALKRDGSVVTWGSSTPGEIPAPANIGAPAADITSLTGLSFNSANGSLTGLPTKTGNFSLRIGAANSAGTGTAPFSLLILSAPGISLTGNLSFGSVIVGQNATRNFSIFNPASGPLTVGSIASSNSSFNLTGSTNFTVAPSTTRNVTVRFQPAAPGNFTANITIASNAGNNSLTATGTGLPAVSPISLTGNLSFGNLTVNQTANRTLSIKNNTAGNVTLSVAVPSWLTANATGNLTLAGNATRNVTVTFRPTSEANFTGNITATSSVGNATISASGAGVHTRIIGLTGDLAFGSALANRTLDKNPTRLLTIANTGTGNLTVTRIERPAGFRVFVSLPDSTLGGNFTTVNVTASGLTVSLAELTGNFTLTVAAGSSKKLLVAFSPTAAATYSGNITVALNATNAAGNSTRAASGTGVTDVTSLISITGNLSFGNVTVNQQAKRTLSITNSDTESHELSFGIGTGFSVAFSPFPYDVMGNPVTLPSGATVNATVTFSPTSATAHSGNFNITSATAGNRTIPATGTATHSRIIGLTGNLSFGSLPVNQTANRTLSIRNSGTGPLIVTGITYPTGFSGNWSGGTIAANATQNVTVSFRPTNNTPLAGNITVTSNATSGTPAIAASGTGIHSRIIGLSGNLSFGSVGVNSTATRNLTITNTGTGPLNVTGITYPAGFSGNFSGTINATASRNVTVSFRPANAGNFSGTISVNSTATSGNATIALSGTAIAAPVITTTNLHGTKGLRFSQRILATNNATSFVNATSLPLGLTINRTTGLISGDLFEVSRIFLSVNITATSAFGTTTAPVIFWFWDDLLSVAGGSLKTSNELNNTLVPSFRIGKYEVTWFEWKAVREWAVANGYTDLANVGEGSDNLHPVRNVNWYDVVKWCNAKSERDGLTPVYQVGGAIYKTGQSEPTVNVAANGYRLPTEAEWEWAARGGVSSKGYTYSGSNDVNAVAWYSTNSSKGTKAVGTKAANELAIHDMSGNVFEWCWDSNSSSRRIRGGGWNSNAGNCTVAARGINRNPDSRNGDSGLRLARSLDEPTSVYGTVGVPVSYKFTSPNTPTSFGNSTALPAGLSLNATTGLISGTPMVAGNSTVTLRATSAGVTGTANVTFSIKSDLVSIKGGTLPQSSALWGTPVLTFRIGTFEVTRSLWQNVRTWGAANGYTDLPSIDPGINGNHPVQEVSWYDALKWCNARSAMENLTPVYKVGNSVYKTGQSEPTQDASANGYRLPTEAEWEWAARGGVSTKGYTYSGGNDLQAVGRFSRGSSGVWPVGGLAANEIGLYDMSGNVKEWCWDVWSDDGKISRRQRGGSWSSGESQCALTHRGGSPFPQNRYDDIGFRLVRKSGN